MELDYIDEKLARRRQIVFGILVLLIIAGAVVYYFWGNLINRGTLLVYLNPPFTIEFYERNEIFNCETSPCKIAQSMGNKNFTVKKTGYETLFEKAYVKLWRKVEIRPQLKMVPHFEKIENIPEDSSVKYELVTDDRNGMQKLIVAGGESGKAIVYFPKKLTNPDAFGNKNTVLVVDREDEAAVYKIDIAAKTRRTIENLPQFKNVISGKWSNDGKYFAASLLRQPNLWLIDESMEARQLDIKANINYAAWTPDNKMIVITETGIISFDPSSETIAQIGVEGDFPENISMFFTDGQGNLCIKSGEFHYRLILE